MRRVLIADDQPGVRTLVRMILEDEPYEILEAAGAQEALDAARRFAPDLVLLDIAMPRMSGIEVCRRLKEDPLTKGVAIVLLSARALEADRREGITAGADGYLTKPFFADDLVRVVAELVDEARR